MSQNGNKMAQRFQEALQRTEQAKDPQPVAALFREGSKLSNLGGDHTDDARQFWTQYLAQFSEIRSEFTGEIVGEQVAALEWESQGKLTDGREVQYRGVSVIEFEGERVTSFRTYYDSAAFVRVKAGVAR